MQHRAAIGSSGARATTGVVEASTGADVLEAVQRLTQPRDTGRGLDGKDEVVSAVNFGFNERAGNPAWACEGGSSSHLRTASVRGGAKRWCGEARALETNHRMLEKASNSRPWMGGQRGNGLELEAREKSSS